MTSRFNPLLFLTLHVQSDWRLGTEVFYIVSTTILLSLAASLTCFEHRFHLQIFELLSRNMQKQFFELDPQGDVLLTLRRPNVLKFFWRSPTSDKLADRPEAGNDAPGSVGPEHKPGPGEPMPGMDEPSAGE